MLKCPTCLRPMEEEKPAMQKAMTQYHTICKCGEVVAKRLMKHGLCGNCRGQMHGDASGRDVRKTPIIMEVVNE